MTSTTKQPGLLPDEQPDEQPTSSRSRCTVAELIDMFSVEEPGQWRAELSVTHSIQGAMGRTVATVLLDARTSSTTSVIREVALQVDEPGWYVGRLSRQATKAPTSTKPRKWSPLCDIEISQSQWDLARGLTPGMGAMMSPSPSPSPSSTTSPSQPRDLASLIREEIARALGKPTTTPDNPLQIAREMLDEQDKRMRESMDRTLAALEKERDRYNDLQKSIALAQSTSTAGAGDVKTALELGQLRAQVEHLRESPPTSMGAALLPTLLDKPLDRTLSILEKMLDAKLETQKDLRQATKAKADAERRHAAALEAQADAMLLRLAAEAKAQGISLEDLATQTDNPEVKRLVQQRQAEPAPPTATATTTTATTSEDSRVATLEETLRVIRAGRYSSEIDDRINAVLGDEDQNESQ